MVLASLEKEEETLKKVKNMLMAELERVQLEETMLERQLAELAQGEEGAPESQDDGDADDSLKDILGIS